MAKLAILGHATRGKEVIGLLEMLGGKNDNHCCGGFLNSIYFINNYGYIESCDRMQHLDYLQLTLEEFLENFPYKVGDKVKTARINDFVGRIINVRLDNNEEEVIYYVEWDDETKSKLYYFAKGLQPYKEETMDKTNKVVFDTNAQCCDIMNHLIKEESMEEIIKIDIPKGYEFAGVDNDNQQVVFEKIGYQYPKTYEECCDALNIAYPYFDAVDYNICASSYKNELFGKFKNSSSVAMPIGKQRETGKKNEKKKQCTM